MKILHVYKDYAIAGGIENHIRLVAERQVAAGHDVTVLVTNDNRHTVREVLNGVKVIKAGRLVKIASTPISTAICREINRQHPDITHLHFPYPVGETASLFCGHGPTVMTYHSDVIRQKRFLALYKPLMMRVLTKAEYLIATSPQYIESSPVLSQMQAKCVAIPLCIETARFRAPHPQATILRQDWAGSPTILFVGLLRYYKGLEYLLQAMCEVDARLVIVGVGDLEGELKTLTHNLRLEDKVTFAGEISDALLPAYYQAADIFCLPACARSEAFGIVQLEALAAGLPIVSTELGTGTSYVNKHDVSGLVVAPRDSAALARALQQLVQNKEQRRRLASGAALRSDEFDVNIMMQRIDDVYHQALAQWAKPTAP